MKWIIINFKKWPGIVWIKRGSLAFIGFLLSPLSWWNDIFINVPLSYAFAWAISRMINIFVSVPRVLFVALFVLGYFFTNLAGFLLLHYSIKGISKSDNNSLLSQILVSLIYVLVIILLSYFDIFKLNLPLDIIPGWVIK